MTEFLTIIVANFDMLNRLSRCLTSSHEHFNTVYDETGYRQFIRLYNALLWIQKISLPCCILSSHTRPIWTLTGLTYVLLSCLNISKYEEIVDPLSALIVNYTVARDAFVL